MEYVYSVEGVNYQGTTIIFDDLTNAIIETQELINSKHSDKESVKPICDVLSKHLNLHNLDISILKYSDGFYVEVPRFKPTVPIFGKFLKEALDKLKQDRSHNFKKIIGSFVDRENGKFHGEISNFPFKISIGKGSLMGGLTPEETSAFILHEVGHLFSYFESFMMTMQMNYIIGEAVEKCRTDDIDYKSSVLKELVDKDVVEDIDPKSISKLQVKDIEAALIASFYQTTMTRFGGTMYRGTDWEQQADQFVVRMGGGKHLVTGLEKLMPKFGLSTRKTMLVSFIYNITTLLVSFGLLTLITYISHKLFLGDATYDNPKERLNRIRSEMVGHLKVLDDSETTKKVLEELTVIEEVIRKTYTNEESDPFMSKIVLWTSPNLRKLKSQKEQEQLVESLINNDLYILSHKFNQFNK